MDINKFNKSEFAKGRVHELYQAANLLRSDKTAPQDVSVFDLAHEQDRPDATLTSENFGGYVDSMLESMGIDTRFDTIQNILTVPDASIKWLVPELVRTAINLGLKRSPIYPNIVSREEAINVLNVQMPYINQSDAAPRYVNEGETIQLGDVSYGSKELKIRKMGRGIKMTYEMMQYTSINLANIFFEDFGVRLGYALDGVAVDILQNGEQRDGSVSAPVIGVETVGTISHRDLLRVWLRLTRMGKSPNTMVGGENAALEILELPEFKKSPNSAAPEARLNIQTPIPTSSNFYIHADVPDNQVIILDPRTTMIKFNAQPLMVESEKIVSNQTEISYATTQTGFAVLFTDSRVVVDASEDFVDQGWPEYMNPDALALETIKYK